MQQGTRSIRRTLTASSGSWTRCYTDTSSGSWPVPAVTAAPAAARPQAAA